jgi:hypothetical protein
MNQIGSQCPVKHNVQFMSVSRSFREKTYVVLVNTLCLHICLCLCLCTTGVSIGLATRMTLAWVSRVRFGASITQSWTCFWFRFCTAVCACLWAAFNVTACRKKRITALKSRKFFENCHNEKHVLNCQDNFMCGMNVFCRSDVPPESIIGVIRLCHNMNGTKQNWNVSCAGSTHITSQMCVLWKHFVVLYGETNLSDKEC